MHSTADIAAPRRAIAGHGQLSWLATALVWTLVVMMIVPEGFDYSLLGNGANPGAGSLITRLIWLGLLGMSTLLVLWRASLSWLTLRNLNSFLIAFALLAILSIVWSLEPRLTLRRDVRLITFLLVAFAFAVAGWHERRLQTVLRPILTLTLLGSIVFGLLMPMYGIHQENAPELHGAWRGLTNHKNSLGALAGVTLLFWLHGWAAREVRAWRAIFGCVVAAVCIWLSRSATSAIATVFGCIFLGLLTKWPAPLRPYLKYAVGAVAFAIGLYALVMLGVIPGRTLLLSPVAAFTGGDMTLTGRSEIWYILNEHIRENPFLGSGYGAYWVGPDPQSPSYAFIVRMNGFYPGSSHNGYLEILNDLGWVGLLTLFGFMATYLKQALHAYAIDKPQGVLYLVLFMHQAIANLSESHWLSVLSVQFVLMTLVTVSLARQLVEQRLRWSMAMREHAILHGAWQLQGRRA